MAVIEVKIIDHPWCIPAFLADRLKLEALMTQAQRHMDGYLASLVTDFDEGPKLEQLVPEIERTVGRKLLPGEIHNAPYGGWRWRVVCARL